MAKKKSTTGRPPKFKSKEELQTAIDKYFKSCDNDKEPYTICDLALACGVDRKTILNYSKKEEFFPTIKEARMRCEAYAERRLFGNAVAGVIFNMKNNYGYKDKIDVEADIDFNITVEFEED